MFSFEIKSLRIRKRMSILRQKIMKHFQRRKNTSISKTEQGKKEEESSFLVFTNLDMSGEYMRAGSVDNTPVIATSTPSKRHRRQNIVILHQDSYLKIYEDFDDIDDLDISDVAPYEEEDDEGQYDDLAYFKIYENITFQFLDF